MCIKSILPKLRGLRFPDSYVIKFFFKEGLDKSSGNVIELGCGSGNNLYLFRAYNYYVCGIDNDSRAINNAKFNFQLLFGKDSGYKFIESDIRHIGSLETNVKFDILLMPSVIYYIRKREFNKVLSRIRNILADKGKFFIRFRSPRDMRVALSKRIGDGEYIIESDITKEKGCILSVYEEYEIISMLKKYLNIANIKTQHIYEENLFNDQKIFNSDIVVWGDFQL